MFRILRRLMRRLLTVPPPLILALLYLVLILLGTGLLSLPAARTGTASLSDLLFMATSAVTVTGLAVMDVPSGFTLFGQAVLMVLLQLGGLGLMTFAVIVLSALGLRVGAVPQFYLRDDLNQHSIAQLLRLVRRIFRIVLTCEVIGALLLALTFVPRFGFWPGLWHALFHSISAFNNGGLSTIPGGMVPFAADLVVNLVIPVLVILGGLGYIVIDDLLRSRCWRQWSLNTKIMLVGNAVLIPSSVMLFLALEWSNPATLGVTDNWAFKLMISWFQGVNTRTAGFNTADVGAMHDSTALMFMMLMFVGGGPTSTAGGIKLTTAFVLLLTTIAFFRRDRQLHAFGRAVEFDSVLKVMALTTFSTILIFFATFLLMIGHDGKFLNLAFEVVSAFGTVGLSRGETGELSDFGRAVIIVVMFIGRVGPLALGFLLARKIVPRVRYPAGRIHLG